MADLLAHYSLGHVFGKALKDPRIRVVFYLGNFFPDLLYKGMLYVLGGRPWFCEPSHSPLMLILFSYLAALLFEEYLRRPIFWALLAGSCLHVLIDVGKDYMGQGVILWGFPFTMDRVELGWYHSSETLFFTLPALGIIVMTELLTWGWKRIKARPYQV